MPALQNFVANSLPTIKASWLNTIDAFVNTLFNGATTAATARQALSVSGQPTFRNRIFNGRFQVGHYSNSITAGSGYIIDQWLAVSGSTGSFTGARISAAGLADYPYFGRMNSNAANAVAAGAYWALEQRIEGIYLDDLNWGTTAAVAMTLSFWARTSVPGTYSVALRNPSNTRSFVSTFTSADNQWHQYAISIPGDLTGTWPLAASTGLLVDFVAGCGTTYQTSVLNTWQPGNFIASTGQTQLMSTNGATYDITGVQLERGAYATDFEMIPHQIELNRLQRYYEVVTANYGGVATLGVTELFPLPERVIKRASPAVVAQQIISVINVTSATFGYYGLGPTHIALLAPTGGYAYQVVLAVDARL